MANPLYEAIERLPNPYAMQERVYRNRIDSEDASLDDLIIAPPHAGMLALESKYGTTALSAPKRSGNRGHENSPRLL